MEATEVDRDAVIAVLTNKLYLLYAHLPPVPGLQSIAI